MKVNGKSSIGEPLPEKFMWPWPLNPWWPWKSQ